MKKDLLLSSIEEVEKELFNLRLDKAKILQELDIVNKQLDFVNMNNLKINNTNNKLIIDTFNLKSNITILQNDIVILDNKKKDINDKYIELQDIVMKYNIEYINMEKDIDKLIKEKTGLEINIGQQKQLNIEKTLEYNKIYDKILIREKTLSLLENNIDNINNKEIDLKQQESELLIKKDRLNLTEIRLNNLKKDLFSKK